MQDILLTGVCHIYMLLKLRYECQLATTVQVVKPDYDGSRIDLINGTADDRIRMVDLEGKFGESRYRNLHELLHANRDCRRRYMVTNIDLNSEEVVSRPEWWQQNGFPQEPRWQYKVLGSGLWYHLYDQNWDVESARAWRACRRNALAAVLQNYPDLKFIVYNDRSVDWWTQQGFPLSRLLRWEIEWIADRHYAEWEERQAEIRRRGGHGFHNYPTEDSYNDLYRIILDDADLISGS